MSDEDTEWIRYNAADLDVAKAYGLDNGLQAIKARVTARKDCPAWLHKELDKLLTKSSKLIQPLIERREVFRRQILVRQNESEKQT